MIKLHRCKQPEMVLPAGFCRADHNPLWAAFPASTSLSLICRRPDFYVAPCPSLHNDAQVNWKAHLLYRSVLHISSISLRLMFPSFGGICLSQGYRVGKSWPYQRNLGFSSLGSCSLRGISYVSHHSSARQVSHRGLDSAGLSDSQYLSVR